MIRPASLAFALSLFASPVLAQALTLSPSVQTALRDAQAAARADQLEHAVCFDAEERVIGTFTGTMGQVTPQCDPQRTVTLAHTHPSGAGPSEGDLTTLFSPLFPHLDRSIILGSDGVVTVMSGLVGRRPDSEQGVAFIAARYVLLNDVYRIADPSPPLTETWPMGRLCAGLSLTCHSGPLDGPITLIETGDLTFADDPAVPVFTPVLRDALAGWILGRPTPTTSWADVGRAAESGPLNGPYRRVVFANDNVNFANTVSPFSSRVNLTRQIADGLESFEILAADSAPGQLDLCVRTGRNLDGAIEARLVDTNFLRLTAGEFEVRCGSRTEPGVSKVFYQRLADGQVSFYPAAEAMAARTGAMGSIAANTGCIQTAETVYRTCDGVSPENYARIQPD
jgi:hypothetical protein